ncbi:MAG TPA: FtsX-like permease family protein [Acidiferrobacterales bacterium]|nr:FtsX-like permease family protein [Acidiferrobacterales bacterium]
MTILLRLAWRNLWRHKRRTWLTASAIAFSAMLLVFMITIQLGAYDMMIDTTLRVYTGQMQVQHSGYKDKPQMRTVVAEAASLAAQLRERTGYATITVRAQGFALASSAERSYGVPVIGVQPEYERGVSTLPHLVKQGRYLADSHAQELVIGSALARNLKIKLGDELTLLGSGRDGSVAATVLPVAGFFESGNPDLDRRLVMMPLATFQETFSLGKDAHLIVVSGPNYESIPQTKAVVSQFIAGQSGLVVLDWDELVPGIKQLIQTDMVQNWITYIALIVIVTLSIMNTFLMSVLERTREFGIMLALGISPLRLGTMVVLESAFLTLLGLIIGIAIGGGIAVWLHFEGFTFPGMKEIYAQFGLPGVIYPILSVESFLLGPSVIFVFTLLAALYPALRIRKLQPVEAIHAA